MDKKKGVIIAVVLLLLLMVGTFAFQRDDEQKYDGEPDSGIQDDGQNGNDGNDSDTDPTTPTEEEENTDDELDGTQTVNGNGGQNGNFVNTNPGNNQNGQGNNTNQGGNNDGNVPTLELFIEKLKASVTSGNDVLTTTNSVDTTLNELLSKYKVLMHNNQVDIGVRVETSNVIMEEINRNLYEGKFISLKDLSDQLKFVGTVVYDFAAGQEFPLQKAPTAAKQ